MVHLIKSLHAHSDKVWSVAVHPTLPLLVSASTDKTSCVYGINDKFPVLSRLEDAHKRSIRSVLFKPPLEADDDFLDLPAVACASFDSTISIWGIDEPEDIDLDLDVDADDLEELSSAQLAQMRALKQAEVLCSPDNQWNLMAIIEGHENEVKAVAWNHTGNLLASCSRDKTVWIWETDGETLEEFECIAVLSDHQQDIKHICWHPTQNILASCSYDDTVRIYMEDDDEWTCVGVLNGHAGTVWYAAFDPRAQKNTIRLVSVSDDLAAKIWVSQKHETGSNERLPSSIRHDAEMEWELAAELPPVHTNSIYSVAWSKNSGRIATVGSDGKLAIYSENDGQWTVEAVHESCHGVYEINCVTWATLNGKEVAITAGDDGNINVWGI